MRDPIKAAATVAALVLGLAGCKAPSLGSPEPKSIPGVTFLGDKAHPVLIFQLSADGRAAVGYIFEGDKQDPPPDDGTAASGKPPPEPPTDSGPHDHHSFRWTEAGGLKIIKTADGRDVDVQAISADGTVAAGHFRNEAGQSHVFRWTEAGGIEDLGAPDGGRIDGFCPSCGATAVAMSTDGSVIYGRYLSIGSFRWTRATGLRNLHIPGVIHAASADGAAAMGVRYVDKDDRVFQHVFLWTRARGFEDLGMPPKTATGDFTVSPEAMSADGSTIVGDYEPNGGGRRAFRWTRVGGFQDLPGEGRTAARDVSADGTVIVGHQSPPDHWVRAVIWRKDAPPQPVGPPELKVFPAIRISADGRTIAGRATVGKHDMRAFVVRLK